jgi:hypothetical protein
MDIHTDGQTYVPLMTEAVFDRTAVATKFRFLPLPAWVRRRRRCRLLSQMMLGQIEEWPFLLMTRIYLHEMK